MVKGLSIPEGQDLPQQRRGPEHAGEVFAEHYALALKSMHPEDALDHARDAAELYLDGIGATRDGDVTEYQGMGVRVLNVGEIAVQVVEALRGNGPAPRFESIKRPVAPRETAEEQQRAMDLAAQLPVPKRLRFDGAGGEAVGL